MRKVSFIILCLLAVFASGDIVAQQKAKTQIASVKQDGDMVRVTLESSQPFIFGNNRYVLYIGSKEFFGRDQDKQDGKGYISFLIPASDYHQMKDGERMYLSYGQVNMQTENMEARAQGARCWPLGDFNSGLLK